MRAVKVWDETLSVMEIWGAEYQVGECVLVMEVLCGKSRRGQ